MGTISITMSGQVRPLREERLRVLVEPETVALVREDGTLQLESPRTGSTYLCGPMGTAIWIALQQHAGHVEPAVEVLAVRWNRNPRWLRADFDTFIGELRDADLVSVVE
ncbi:MULTISPECIES: PqqD family peptide modification chaperone [unclassified Streptomyces]|uniref:PqqD family peptide modification chaperone n=1 Tax=unclassified Streptomyces TaxID=2593676 RepID=UPI00117E6627|nr:MULTISPECIES: PqqD family peptide modification chaperone [unclassified Streptomyces]TRO55948.1 PqqD family protein [Streptomyces sp. IB201691-2A2]